MQMLLGAVLIDALHPALEHGGVAFDRIGVGIATHILVCAVPHDAMLSELAANLEVVPGLVRHQAGFLGDVLARDRRHGGGLKIVHNHAAGVSRLAVNQR